MVLRKLRFGHWCGSKLSLVLILIQCYVPCSPLSEKVGPICEPLWLHRRPRRECGTPTIINVTQPKWTVYSASMCHASLIVISTQEALHALQSKCHPVHVVLLSCEWGLLSKAFRKSCHVRDEEIRRAGRKTLLSSSEHRCPSLPPPWRSQMSTNLSVITVLMSDGFFMRTEGGQKSAIDLLW